MMQMTSLRHRRFVVVVVVDVVIATTLTSSQRRDTSSLSWHQSLHVDVVDDVVLWRRCLYNHMKTSPHGWCHCCHDVDVLMSSWRRWRRRRDNVVATTSMKRRWRPRRWRRNETTLSVSWWRRRHANVITHVHGRRAGVPSCAIPSDPSSGLSCFSETLVLYHRSQILYSAFRRQNSWQQIPLHILLSVDLSSHIPWWECNISPIIS